MKQRRVAIKQDAAEAGVSITTIPRFRAPLGDFFGVGHAVAKGNDFSSVAYWYQTGKHADHAELPSVEDRLPRRWPEHWLWDGQAERRMSTNTMRTWETK